MPKAAIVVTARCGLWPAWPPCESVIVAKRIARRRFKSFPAAAGQRIYTTRLARKIPIIGLGAASPQAHPAADLRMSTVLETIDGGTRYLEKRGIDDARRNMQMLVARQLGCNRMDLYLQFDRPMEERDLAPLRETLKKRGEGIPLQHLLGSVWFHKHEFKTDARALIPRPETEELAEWILKWELPAGQRVLDMGCGSGVLGLTLAAERPAWDVTLADVSADALSLAQENAAA